MRNVYMKKNFFTFFGIYIIYISLFPLTSAKNAILRRAFLHDDLKFAWIPCIFFSIPTGPGMIKKIKKATPLPFRQPSFSTIGPLAGQTISPQTQLQYMEQLQGKAPLNRGQNFGNFGVLGNLGQSNMTSEQLWGIFLRCFFLDEKKIDFSFSKKI